jgi:hypothetical protein
MQREPDVGLSRSPIMFISVVFPEPDDPVIATDSHAFILRDILFSMGDCEPPKT